MKKGFSFKKLFMAFVYAARGYKRVYHEEQNMWVHTIIALWVLIFGFIFQITHTEWLFLIFAIGMVIGAEILNTTVENMVDLVTVHFHEKAEIAKNTAAAFVMVLTITAALIGLIIFIPRVVELIRGLS